MSKASIKASIDTKKARIDSIKKDIANIRARKTASKEKSYKQHCDAEIRLRQTNIKTIQAEIASLRERMKHEK